MSRPQCIQYENAFYHVMNRGRGRQIIFHSDEYYSTFIQTLKEVYERFDALIHAYCLMGTHYHMLSEKNFCDGKRVRFYEIGLTPFLLNMTAL